MHSRPGPLLLTVPYPSFELPDDASLATANGNLEKRDILLLSFWAASCKDNNYGGKKDENSGGIRSVLENFMHGHNNSSRRDKVNQSSIACEFDQHAICAKGNACDLPTGPDSMHQLAATSRYCLEPGGNTPTRSHFYVAALFGCIPVLFEGGNINYPNQTTLWPWRRSSSEGEDPGTGGLRYRDFSIVLRVEDVVRNPSLVMQAIEKSDYRALQIGLFNAVKSLAYSNKHHTRDAFTSIEELVCAETGRDLL